MAGEREAFRDFLRGYDRTAEGSGSDKEPPVDKMSRKDLKIQYESGRDRGLSRADAAEDVLVNFADVRGETKYGSKAKKYIKKLRRFARERTMITKTQPVGPTKTVVAMSVTTVLHLVSLVIPRALTPVCLPVLILTI